jgi:hypothetical protein
MNGPAGAASMSLGIVTSVMGRKIYVKALSKFLPPWRRNSMPRGVPNKQTSNGKVIGKGEAVRRALAELGPNAMPTEIHEWVKSQFKIDVEPNSISAFKTMLKKRSGKKKGKHGTAKSQGLAVSKMDAVRGALRKLGRKAKPQEIQSFIKSEFNVEMGPTLISNYKSHLFRKARKRRRKMRKQAAAAAPAPVAGEFSIRDIQTVRQVVEQIGADKVQELAAVLAK